MATNKQVRLAAHPAGMPTEADFRLTEEPVPEPGSEAALVRNIYLSVDPYMRGRMNAAASYAPSVELGQVMVGGTVGEVVSSRADALKPGDFVEGYLGWQQYGVAPAEQLRKLDPRLAPVSTALGVLGMPGLTAYFGLLEIGKPKAGETVVVSGAAGAVGSLAGQIARIHGCRAIGVAGSDRKIDYITGELGFDGGLNYRTTPDYVARLRELCPKGVDVYFDNVGGAVTDAVMRLINPHARVVVCGQISQYNVERPDLGPRWFGQILVKQARAEGFLVFQFLDRYEDGRRQMAEWLNSGRLKYRENVIEGIENAARAFLDLFEGRNVGKQLVKIG